MGAYQIFVYLQLLDLLTTLLGFRLGAAEASPFIRLMMHVGPATGDRRSLFLPEQISRHPLDFVLVGGLVIWNQIVMLAVPGHIG
jgi:hypothetical protein